VLGVYSVAKVLASKPLQLIAPIISKVNFPLMAKVQNDKQKLKEFYIASIKYLFAVVVVIYITMAFEASDLIRIIYRDKWVSAIGIFQILTLMFVIKAIRNPMGSLILASGKVNWRFYWNLSMLGIIPGIIYLSSFYGINSIVLSLIGFYIIAFFISFKLITQRILSISISEIIYPVLHLLLIMIPSIIAMFVLRELIDNIYIRIVVVSFISLVLYLFTFYKFYNTFFEEIKRNIIDKQD
jgi:O-antigen/teichoic acid export membrane protein